MPLPNNFNQWEFLQDIVRRDYNKAVNAYFKNTPSNDLSTNKSKLKQACTHNDSDSALETLIKMLFFEFSIGKAQSIQTPIYGIPVQEFQRNVKFKPQVRLYFKEPFNVETHDISVAQVRGEITFRLVNETSDSISRAKAELLARAIKQHLNEDVGWFPIHGELYFVTSNYPPGMALWIEGSLNDKSTYGHKILNIGEKLPEITTGLDFKPVLRWDGTRTQEIRIPPFLDGTDGVTLYAVFTVNSPDSYTIIKTISGNDNWYHDSDDNGDFGTFQDTPLTMYPLDMPASGSHLVSIHATSNTYEVLLNNKSKGLVPGSYNPGKIFAIGSRSRPFNGDIALILCYPGFLSPTSFFHRNCIHKIKSFYPSLPLLIDNNEDS